MVKKTKQFVWKSDGEEAKFLKKLFTDGTVDSETPWTEVFEDYQHVWPGEFYAWIRDMYLTKILILSTVAKQI